MSRVPFSRKLDDPDYPESNSEYEFVATTAVGEDGRLVEGRQALSLDMWFPLKTMLVYIALNGSRHCDRIVARLPGGCDLLHAIYQAETVRTETIRDVLIKHFVRLRRMSLVQAERNGVTIGTLVLTYPHYLFASQGRHDFDSYMDCYLELLLRVWGQHVKYRIVSEGQAVALYTCEPFFDSVSGRSKTGRGSVSTFRHAVVGSADDRGRREQ